MRFATAAQIRQCSSGVPEADGALLRTCQSLRDELEEGKSNQHSNRLRSNSPFVSFTSCGALFLASELRNLHLFSGVATAEVDGAIEEAAAWLFDFNSRVRMRENGEKGNLPRLTVSAASGLHRHTVATIKKFPRTNHFREFVFDISWIKTSDDSILVCMNSVEDRASVDYGNSFASRRASMTSCYFLEKITELSCKVTLCSKVNFGGVVPVAALRTSIPFDLLGDVDALRVALERNDVVDENAIDDMVLVMKHEKQEMNELDEDETIERVRAVFRNLIPGKVIGSADHFVEIIACASLGDRRLPSMSQAAGVGVSKFVATLSLRRRVLPNGESRRARPGELVTATVVVDATIEECAAWTFLKCSRERIQSFYDTEVGASSKREKIVNSHRRETTEEFLDTTVQGRPHSSLKSIAWDSIWQKHDANSFLIVDELVTTNEEDKISASSGKSEVRFDASSMLSDTFAQTKVVMTLRLDTAGRLLVASDELQASKVRHLSELRERFDKTVVIDRKERNVVAAAMAWNEETYDDEEEKVLALGLDIMNMYDKLKHKKKVRGRGFACFDCVRSFTNFAPLAPSSFASLRLGVIVVFPSLVVYLVHRWG